MGEDNCHSHNQLRAPSQKKQRDPINPFKKIQIDQWENWQKT